MKRYNINLSRFKCTAKALLGGVLVTMFGACDDFLTIYPTNSVVEDNYWKVEADVDGMVANCYRSMIQLGFMERFLVWGEIRSDNVMEGNFSNGGNSSLRDINEINIMPTNGYCSWADYYKVINNCHTVRKFAPDVVTLDPDYTEYDFKAHEGEMKAISALCHFYLVRAFRDIPLLKEAVTQDSQDLYPVQVGPIEALDWIIEELKDAENKVIQSGNYISNNENKGRITSDAVRAIIADALLWRASFKTFEGIDAKADYTECIDYCEKVLEARRQYIKKYVNANTNSTYKKLIEEKYPLVKSYPEVRDFASGDLAYNEVFGPGMNSIPESIFELQMTGDVENQNFLVTYYYGREKGQNAPFAVGKTLLDKYAKTDYRRESFIAAAETEEDPSYVLKYTAARTNGKFTGDGTEPMQPDYRETKEQTDGSKANSGKRYLQDCNWIIYRLSDVMLMKAEALAYRNNSGDLDEAFELVEAVYYRSNDKIMAEEKGTLLNKSNYNTAATMQNLVLDERQRELAFEGKRWFDLVRKALRTSKVNAEGESVNDISGVLDIIVNGKYVSNPKSYKNKMPDINYFFFPISESELNTYAGEENEHKLKQNPAYETKSTIEQN